MSDVVVDRLRLRGPAARSLAGVAARSLPAALAAALADIDDVRLPVVRVRLEVDPTSCDEQTLALLWADAIRHGVLTAGARVRGPGRDPVAGDRGAGVPRQAADPAVAGGTVAAVDPVDALVAVLLRWLGSGAPRWRLPVAAGALRHPASAARAAELLGPSRAAAVAAALERAGRSWRGSPGRPAEAAAGHAPTEDPPAPAPREPGTRREPGGPGPVRPGPAPVHDDGAPPRAGPLVAAADLLAPVFEALQPGATGAVDLSSASRVGGLVLLSPWLADLCRDLTERHRDLDPVTVRRHALAALAAPSDPAAAEDPLVRLLAGDRAPAVAQARSPLAPVPDPEGLARAAEEVLARFAGLLPGFERSTPGFVRGEWIARAGLLDTEASPARLSLQRRPLDVVLHRLPFPVGLFRLPWTPPVAVRWAP